MVVPRTATIVVIHVDVKLMCGTNAAASTAFQSGCTTNAVMT